MKILIICVLLAGCAMSAEEMAKAKKDCAAVGMGVRWWVNGITYSIDRAQCDPNVVVKKGAE